MQQAAWWTLFGAFAVVTTAGVLAGVAERQEDRAVRLSTRIDADTGAQLRYADEQDEYEDILRLGRRTQWASRGLLIAGGAITIAAVTLFIVGRKRSPKSDRRARIRLGPGMQVRF